MAAVSELKVPWTARVARWTDPEVMRQHEDKVLLLLTLIIGAVVGLVVVAFILVTENLGSRMYPAHAPAWRRLIVPVVGSLGTGFLLARYFPNARGSGIPQTKVALFLRDGFIAFRTVLGKFGLSAVALASGIALGREGPSVQVGAGIASVLGRRLGLSQSSIRALVPVGASAALAAAFNTPIAAVLFSLEEVMGDMHAPVLGSIVLSSATSWIVLHLILGDEPLFHVPPYQLVNPLEFLIYAVLGVVGGLVSVAFVKLLLKLRSYFLKLPRETQWWQPAVGGLTVGALGWFFPNVLGVGYGFVGQALNGEMIIRVMALLVLLKLVATATCYASGNAGGIFGPSLFLGAMMGGSVGGVAHMLLPDFTGSAGAYALVGMGATFAGIIRVPLTSVIMIFEITRDYSIIVPLMIANLISYFISSRLQEEPIYEALQHQDGIHLPSGVHAREALLMVAQAYRQAPQVLSSDLTIDEAAEKVNTETGAWPVVDAHGLRGMLTASSLEQALQAGYGGRELAEIIPEPHTEDLNAEHFPHVHLDHTLDTAMHRIAETGVTVLPVVSRTNVRELKGTISVPDIMAAYALGKAHDTAPAATVHGGRPLVWLIGTLVVLIGLAVVGGSLAYYYREERAGRAQLFYKRGNELAQRGVYDQAVEQYRNALSITHSSQNRLALALALLKAGHANEAGIYLKELLNSDANSGPANLGMGRVWAQRGELDNAIGFYHHAIYGSWAENAAQQRAQARIELVQLLAKQGRTQQARAELLAAAAALPPDAATRKQVARMLMDFGLDKEATDIYRDLAKRDPRDEEAYLGLAQAEYALADYGSTRQALDAALNLNPNDVTARRLRESCDEIAALDPARRGLGSMERFNRSQQLLTLVVTSVEKCASPDVAAMIQTARSYLALKRPRSYSEAAENETTLAEQLWTTGAKACGAPAPADTPLARVLARVMAR